jgi:hypothetical protein
VRLFIIISKKFKQQPTPLYNTYYKHKKTSNRLENTFKESLFIGKGKKRHNNISHNLRKDKQVIKHL